MKYFVRIVVLVLAVSTPAFAQLATGSITGKIVDEQGGVLPGVTVTLLGVDATQTFVTDGTGEYRFLNLAPGPYKITAALQGFTTIVRDNVTVATGRNVDLPIAMKIATVAETITVSGEAPIIDTKETGTATNITSDELTRIPTSRDPFAIMRTVPGVLVDRVNVGGNETGQQSNFASKGTRPQDATWTMDGVEITDMAAAGASPSYFNFDNFDEINVATAGQGITSRTGGVGLNFVVKRGTNRFHGGARGYFDNASLESDNTPAELRALGFQHNCPAGTLGTSCFESDHNKQISDYGFDIGGPIWRDKAWFYGSYSLQDIRLVRRSGKLTDRTQLKNPDVKLNWQSTKKDMISFLYFDGFKIKDGRSPGVSGILFDAPSATFHQDNAYTGNPLHGLWKIADDRVITPNMFLSAKFASYNTGFILDPEGGLDQSAGRNFVTAQSYGSVNESVNIRPQLVGNADLNSFLTGFGGSHDLKYGFGLRRVLSTSETIWPGDMILGLVNSPTDARARVFRSGNGTNRAMYFDLYAGDTISHDRVTIDLGVRYDRQWGSALPSSTRSNPAFPDLLPSINFAGYTAPFTWNTLSPRAGLTYALDDAKRTVVRASYSRYASQLDTTTIGYKNVSSQAGFAEWRWNDLNGDHLVEPNEVINPTISGIIAGSPGASFNPNNPASVVSPRAIDPNLKPPVTQSFVAGVDRELMGNLALQINYSYTRASNLFDDFTNFISPRVGVAPGVNGNYTPGAVLTGTLPNGNPYSAQTYVPNAALVAASNGGFLLTSVPGYYTDYNGVEVSLVKRLSNRWMGRVGFSYNDAREHYTDINGIYDTNGNPTPTLTESLKDGSQFAPQSGGSGSGSIYINARWQFNANAMYQAWKGIEVSANVFGRQGYPFPLFRQASIPNEGTLQVLVTPAIDTFRYPNLWDTDARLAKTFKVQSASIRVIGDLFNVFDANTALVRNNNIASSSFNTLAQNLSPRIFRVGLVVGF